MDKNQTIGFTLIFVLLMVYFYLAPEPQPPTPDTEQQKEDSLVQSPETPPAEVEPTDETDEIPLPDSVLSAQWGIFSSGIKGEEVATQLENDDVRITLSSKGGRVKEVVVKGYKQPNGKPVKLLTAQSNELRWLLPTTLPQGNVDISKLYFQLENRTKRSVTFRLDLGAGKYISKTYSLDPKGFVVDYDLDVSSLKSVLAEDYLEVSWRDDLRLLEPSMEISRRYATVNYYTTEADFDQLSAASTSLQEETLEQPVRWIAMKQRFFNAALLTEKHFNGVSVSSNVNEADTATVKMLRADFRVPLTALAAEGNLRYYFGPNEFYTMREVTPGFEENLYLGWSIFGLISRYVILPLFTFLEGFIASYGILILVMVVLIKLALSPLTYRSYFSQAKTKFIQPELNELEEKYGDDKQKAQQEKLKLMTQVGANPMLGCIPMLLQMPILFALFMFFPVLIYLRGEPFLWSADLSNYDSIMSLPFDIPFYGDHVSAFTLLMAVGQLSSVLITGQTPTTPQNSPINMKYMMYFMPVMLLFFFNSYPSGLTLYYFVSTAITIVLTLAIRNFFINEDKIAAIIERNRKKNQGKKKSSFMSKLEEAQKAQQEAAEKRKKLKQQQAKRKSNKGGRKK